MSPLVSIPTDAGASLDDVQAQSNLTPRQLLIWVSQEMDRRAFDQNVAGLFIIDAAIDGRAFQQAAQMLVQSCDCLRTVIDAVHGVPRQRVLDHIDVMIETLDLRGTAQPESILTRLASERVRKPFELRRQLFELSLYHLKDARSAWLLTMHHIVSDGASVAIMLEMLSGLYAQALRGEPLSLAREVVPFKAFIDSQRAYIASAEHTADAAWWAAQLADGSPTRLYGKRAPALGGTARRRTVDLGDARSTRLRALAERVSPLLGTHQGTQNLLVTALLVWLHKTGPNEALTLALSHHNRTATYLGTPGLLMQLLPMRVRLSPRDTFVTLLEHVTDAGLEALEHARYAVSNPVGKRAWDVVVNYLPAPLAQFAGHAVEHEWVFTEHASQALVMNIHDFSASKRLTLSFDTLDEAFPEPCQALLADHFLTVVDAMLENPRQTIGEINVLTPDERASLVSVSLPAPASPEGTFVDLFEASARRRGTRPAVVGDAATLTFDALNTQAEQLAHRLISLGIRPGTFVGVLLQDSTLAPIAVLGVLKAGAAYMGLDAKHPDERIDFMLEDASVDVVITERCLTHKGRASGIRRLVLDDLAESELLAALPSAPAAPRPALDDLAYVIYTSGSTGRPKGVRVKHRSLAAFLQATSTAWIDEDDTVWFTSPLTFDMHVGDLLLPLSIGAAVAPVPRDMVNDGLRLRQLFETGRASASFATPSTFRMLIDAGWQGDARMKLLCGGEPMSTDLARELSTRVAELQNVYGPTETTCYVLAHRVGREEGSVPIGRPLPGVRTYIVDSQGCLVPRGVPGELWIGGPQVALDYLHAPDLSAARFTPDPFCDAPNARVYRSGDQVRLRSDAAIEFLGRLDGQVKIRGFRIELGEIEAALARQPSIRDAVVSVSDDDSGERRLVAWFCGDADIGALREALLRQLPEYMVPSAFVPMESFPLTANGKIDRARLPRPTVSERAKPSTDAETEDLLEFQIRKSFEDVLGGQPVQLDDSFFERGGTSLLAVRLLSRLEQTLERPVSSLQVLFEAPTPRALAKRLREAGWEAHLRALVCLQPRGDGPPFFCVHAFIGDVCRDLARHCGLRNPFYGFQPRGLDGREQPLRTVREMATYYIAQMRAVQAEGPYMIGGYSFGGIVAHEMARQLHEAGDPVGLLAIIDTSPVNHRPRSLRAKLRNLVNKPLIAAEQMMAALRRTSSHSLAARVGRRLRLATRRPTGERADARAFAGVIGMISEMYGMSSWPRNYQQIAQQNLLAMLGHTPGCYPGEVTLIRRRSATYRFALEPVDRAWSEVAERVTIHHVDGDHDEIMVEPGVRQVGSIVRACLTSAALMSSPSPQSSERHDKEPS